jgi:hypothetical protein
VSRGESRDPRRPAIADAFSLKRWADVTGTPAENLPPVPNLTLIEVAAEDNVIAAIVADPQWSHCILWADGDWPADESPSEAGYAATVAAFATALGVTADYLRGIFGAAPNGRTRGEIADEVAAWLKTRPKQEA